MVVLVVQFVQTVFLLWLSLVLSSESAATELRMCEDGQNQTIEAGYEADIVHGYSVGQIQTKHRHFCNLRLQNMPEFSWVSIDVHYLGSGFCSSEHGFCNYLKINVADDSKFINVKSVITFFGIPSLTITVQSYPTGNAKFNLTYRVAEVVALEEGPNHRDVRISPSGSGYIVSHWNYADKIVAQHNYRGSLNHSLTLTGLGNRQLTIQVNHFNMGGRAQCSVMSTACCDHLEMLGYKTFYHLDSLPYNFTVTPVDGKVTFLLTTCLGSRGQGFRLFFKAAKRQRLNHSTTIAGYTFTANFTESEETTEIMDMDNHTAIGIGTATSVVALIAMIVMSICIVRKCNTRTEGAHTGSPTSSSSSLNQENTLMSSRPADAGSCFPATLMQEIPVNKNASGGTAALQEGALTEPRAAEPVELIDNDLYGS